MRSPAPTGEPGTQDPAQFPSKIQADSTGRRQESRVSSGPGGVLTAAVKPAASEPRNPRRVGAVFDRCPSP